MAKNYTSHAKARQFERTNFGDMGLRAYQQQQKTIIDAMKLQKSQHKEIRDDFLSADIAKTNKEHLNRQELKEFEDDAWENKSLSKKIRAEREIEALKQKEKDALRSAEFWQDFSTTHAANFGKLASNIHDAIDLRYATKATDEAMTSGLYDKVITQTSLLNNISSAGLVNEQHKINQDKTKTAEEKNEEGAHARSIEQTRSHNKDRIFSAQLIEDSEKIVTHLEDTFRQAKIPLTRDNIREKVHERALEIMGELGMNPSSEGGQKFLQQMWAVASNTQTRYTNTYRAIRDYNAIYGNPDKGETGFLDLAKASSGTDTPYDWENNMNNMISLHQNRWVLDDKGNASLVSLSPRQAIEGVHDLLIENGIVTAENHERLLNIPYPGQPLTPEIIAGTSEDKRNLTYDRHPQLRERVETAIADKEDDKIKAREKADANKDKKALIQLKVDLEDNKYDLNNKEDLDALITANAGNKTTLEFLHKANKFNPTYNDVQGYLVNEDLNSKYLSNEYNAYMDTLQYQGNEARQRLAPLTKQLRDMNENGAKNEQVRKWAKDTVKAELQVGTLNQFSHPSADQIDEILIQDFYFEFRKVADDDSLDAGQKVAAAYKAVKEKFDSGTGLYARTGEGNATVFYAVPGYEGADEAQGMSLKTASNQIGTGGGWENFFSKYENSYLDKKQKEIHILSDDYIQENLRNIINGKEMTKDTTGVLDLLYETQPDRGDKTLTKTQLFNKIVAGRGVKTFAQPGSLDYAQWKAVNYPWKVEGLRRKSDKNQLALGVWLDISEATGQPVIAPDLIGKSKMDMFKNTFEGDPSIDEAYELLHDPNNLGQEWLQNQNNIYGYDYFRGDFPIKSGGIS